MADDKLSRFRHLERSRSSTQQPAAAAPASRFDALQGPGQAPVSGPALVATAERFQDQKPSLELAVASPEDQPFIRCCRCESDNNVHQTSCANCGGDFSTPEQRAFNDALWEKRRQEAAADAQRAEVVRQQREESESLVDAKRRMGAELARAVADQTRARLDQDAMMANGWRGEGTALGMLFNRLSERARLGVVLGTVVAAGVLLIIPATRPLGGLIVVGGVSILVSAWWWR